MTLEQLIQQRIYRLENVPDTMLSVVDKENEKLFKAALKRLGELETKDSKIVASRGNLAKINAVLEDLKQVLFKGDYVEAVKLFAAEINNQALLNNSILAKVADSFKDSEMFKAARERAVKNTLLLMGEQGIASNFLQPLEEILNTSVVSAVKYTDAVETLRRNMVGEDAILGKYAKQIVTDTFAVADRQYVKLTSEAYKIEFFKYSGGKVEGTREFCLERYGKIFHQKEIAEWGNFERTGDFKLPKYLFTTSKGVKIYWQGMNYNTNAATVFSYLGGYECRHVLVPIATRYVPKSELERAERLGYYKVAK